jgi:SSS family solute:Na+ symporter
MHGFELLDWAIVSLYLTATMIAGLAMRKYIGKVEHFIVAGREMDVYLGVASLAASEFGIVTVVYASELGAKDGFAGATPGILMTLAMLGVGLTGFVINPLRRSGAMTIPEVFDKKFGSGVRWLAGVVMVLGGVLNMGIFLRVAGEFLMIVTGIPLRHLELTMTILFLMVLIYTSLGGMLSVLVTDFLQFIIMGLGIVIVSVLTFMNTSWSDVVASVTAQHGAGGFNPLVNPDMGVGYVVWQGLNLLAVTLTWQTIVQRVLSSRDQATARKVYVRTSFYFTGRFLIPGFWAMAAISVIGKTHLPAKALHVIPVYLGTLLPPGLLGIVVAAMLAAEMSTDSSYVLTWSSVLYNDIICPLRKEPFSDRVGLLLNRLIILCIGAFLIIYGLWYQLPGRAWDYLSITANIYVSALSVLLVSCCYWKRANTTGAYAAIIGGAVTPIAFILTRYAENVQLAGLASYALAAAGMVAGSWIGSRKEKEAGMS